jgi:hypothetical protein
MRYAEQHEPAHGSDSNKEKKYGEEESFEQAGKAAEGFGKFFLLASIALDARGETVKLFLNALDLPTLSFHLGAQSTALVLDLAKLTIQRGEVRPQYARLVRSYTGEYRQQLGGIRQKRAELGKRAQAGQSEGPQAASTVGGKCRLSSSR